MSTVIEPDYEAALNGRMIYYNDSQSMWDALGVNALDPDKAQSPALLPGHMIWAARKLPPLRLMFHQMARLGAEHAPPPYIALVRKGNYQDFYITVRTARHRFEIAGKRNDFPDRERFMPHTMLIGTYDHALSAAFVSVFNNAQCRPIMEDGIGVMRNLLTHVNIEDPGAATDMIDREIMWLQHRMR